MWGWVGGWVYALVDGINLVFQALSFSPSLSLARARFLSLSRFLHLNLKLKMPGLGNAKLVNSGDKLSLNLKLNPSRKTAYPKLNPKQLSMPGLGFRFASTPRLAPRPPSPPPPPLPDTRPLNPTPRAPTPSVLSKNPEISEIPVSKKNPPRAASLRGPCGARYRLRNTPQPFPPTKGGGEIKGLGHFEDSVFNSYRN